MKTKPPALAAILTISVVLCACGNKKEAESVETDEPQSREGKILKAAKEAAENADSKSFKLDEPKGIEGR